MTLHPVCNRSWVHVCTHVVLTNSTQVCAKEREGGGYACTVLNMQHTVYSGTSLIRTPLGQKKVSLLVRCPDSRGCNVHKQGVWDSQMCPVY